MRSKAAMAIRFGACLLLSACARFESSGLPGSAASMAHDQIMLVRQSPPSFGYYRLATQSKTYPDVGLFLQKRGVPDFLAETSKDKRHYFIFYYLKARQAYACRTNSTPSAGAVEFAGPYPITDGEFRLLNSFRQEKSKAR
jgi:hypothetical protein